MQNTTKKKEVAKMLAPFRYDPASLFGPKYKSARKQILETLTAKKVLVKDTGFYKFMDALYSEFNIDKKAACLAVQEQQLAEAVKKEAFL